MRSSPIQQLTLLTLVPAVAALAAAAYALALSQWATPGAQIPSDAEHRVSVARNILYRASTGANAGALREQLARLEAPVAGADHGISNAASWLGLDRLPLIRATERLDARIVSFRDATDAWLDAGRPGARPVPPGLHRRLAGMVEASQRLIDVWSRLHGRVHGHYLAALGVVGVSGLMALGFGTLGVRRYHRQQRQAEEQRLDADALLRQMADNIREVFFVRDLEHTRMVYVNPAYETLWQRSRASLYANPRDFIEAVHPDDREHVLAAMRDQERGHLFNAEYRIVRPDDTVRWIHARTFPIYNHAGRLYRLAGIAEDITERKEHEARRLAEEREHRTALVREVHHRIKNHLQGLSELLRQHAARHPEATEALQPVRAQIHSIALVHGLQSHTGGDLRLCDTIEAIVEAHHGLAEPGRAPQLTERPHLPVFVPPDQAVPLALTINELLMNAVKHGTGPPPQVTMSFDEQAGQATIWVRNGVDATAEPPNLEGGTQGNGLRLIRALLPSDGAELSLTARQRHVVACLQLSPPAVRRRDTPDDPESTDGQRHWRPSA